MTHCRALDIVPVIVWSGLGIRRFKSINSYTMKMTKRESAWSHLDKNPALALNSFIASNSHDFNELVIFINTILDVKGIEYIRAPFISGAQLAYMENPVNDFISLAYGPSELLVHPIERLILSIDFVKHSFVSVDKSKFLETMRISHESFQDLALLAGCDICASFPLVSEPLARFSFGALLEIFSQFGNGIDLVKYYSNHAAMKKANYLQAFMKAKASVKYHFVLDQSSTTVSLCNEKLAGGLEDIFGKRFPDMVYFLFSQCIISQDILLPFFSNVCIESPPLCNGDNNDYYKVVSEMEDFRKLVYSFVYSSLPENTFLDEVQVESKELGKKTLVLGKVEVGFRVVSPIIRARECQKLETEFVNLAVVQRLRDTATTGKTFADPDSVLFAINDMLIEVSGLEMKECNEELIVLGKLLELNLIHGKKIKTPLNDNESITLICRVMCLIKSSLVVPWKGELDRSLLEFHSVAKYVFKSYRLLSEALTLKLFTDNHNHLDPNGYKTLASRLPFRIESSTVMGLVFQKLLRGESIDGLGISNHDLRKGLDFWKQAVEYVTRYSQSHSEIFRKADLLMTPLSYLTNK